MFRWILKFADATGKLAQWRLCLLEFNIEIVDHSRIMQQVADDFTRVPTEIADDTSLDKDVQMMLFADDNEPDAACVLPRFIAEKEGLFEPALPLVVSLAKKPSYAKPLTLQEFKKAQSMDASCKQADAGSEIPDYAISYNWSGILLCNEL